MIEKQITICADDFGQNQSIDEGILELVKLKRLQAVTVFTESTGWKLRASQLRAFEQSIDIGVHLNLTQHFSNSSKKYGLGELLLRSHLGLISLETIKNDFRRQIELYIAKMHRLPTFLDGHQHVHAFPVINQALKEVIVEFWGDKPTLYVRDTSKLSVNPDGFLFKKLILKISCEGLFKKMAAIGVNTTQAFTGVYNFSPNANYAELVQSWFRESHHHSLMMCHPGSAQKSEDDPLYQARLNEFNYLSSDNFLIDCNSMKVKLVRYSEIIRA